jgi:hypothetical protein
MAYVGPEDRSVRPAIANRIEKLAEAAATALGRHYEQVAQPERSGRNGEGYARLLEKALTGGDDPGRGHRSLGRAKDEEAQSMAEACLDRRFRETTVEGPAELSDSRVRRADLFELQTRRSGRGRLERATQDEDVAVLNPGAPQKRVQPGPQSHHPPGTGATLTVPEATRSGGSPHSPSGSLPHSWRLFPRFFRHSCRHLWMSTTPMKGRGFRSSRPTIGEKVLCGSAWYQ